MTQYTRPATWEDVKTVARALAAEGVEYALIGGYAIAAHGYNRFTEDVDILVNPSRENTRRWIRALATLPDHASLELEGEDDVMEGEGPPAVRINDEFTVDVMGAACGHTWDELKSHIIEVELDETPVRLLDLEGLLLTKEGLRDKDRADAMVLRRAIEKLRAQK